MINKEKFDVLYIKVNLKLIFFIDIILEQIKIIINYLDYFFVYKLMLKKMKLG